MYLNIYNKFMAQNYTPIDYLIKKYKQQSAVTKPKEAEPIPINQEKIEIKEVVEYEIEEEVKPFVNVRKETIKLPPDLKKLGLKAEETTKFPSYQNIKIPIADDKVLPGLHAPLTSSLRWLSTLAIYILARAHLTLKKIHGHVVRVLKN